MKPKKKIDSMDLKIITMLQSDPSLTHSYIATQLGRSQPAIGARIKKLYELGLLETQVGVNFKKTDSLQLVQVNLNTTRPQEIMLMGRVCPNVINCLKVSGTNNITLFMASSNIKRLDNVIDRHFRSNPDVKSVSMNIITDFATKFVLPFNFEAEKYVDGQDPCINSPLCLKARKMISTMENTPIESATFKIPATKN
jgi:Lrp/AsnC family transcriptional regulator, leucine-responsive regulatory protein